MSTRGTIVHETPLQAWSIEVDGSVHAILFVCEPHAGVALARASAALAFSHDGQRLVRLPQLDVVPELLDRSVCFACRLGGPAAPLVWGPDVGKWGETGLRWGGTKLGDDPNRKLGDDPSRKLGDATPSANGHSHKENLQ